MYNCDQSDSLNIANVVVDDKFEIGDVDKREIAIVEISVKVGGIFCTFVIEKVRAKG